jgi:glyoxylase-like metal-dependent hydrolase (beta-lactamase superfamily II)
MKKFTSSLVMSLLAVSSMVTISQTQAQPISSIQQQKQVPGYYQYSFGDYQITALLDGTNYLSKALFKNIPEAEVQQILKKYYVDQAKGIQTSVNAFLVNTGEELILVDSGASSCNGANFGSIYSNLQASGQKPEQVNTVLLTHLHPDHVCGISKNGAANFPNANIYVSQAELDFWMNPKTIEKLPKAKQAGFLATVDKIKKAIAPYQAKNQLKTFKTGDKIHAFDVVSSAGHTPGHFGFSLKSQAQEMVFIGDIVHSHTLQFDRPQTSVDFDVDPKKAVETRLKYFADYAKNGQTIAAPHLPFPGIGHIYSKDPKSYQWIPVHFKD